MWRSDVVVWSLSLSQHHSRAIAHEIFGCSDRDRRRVDSRETRTVTNGEMVKAGRLQQKMELGAELPSTHEKQTCTAAPVPVESRRRLALARGRLSTGWQPWQQLATWQPLATWRPLATHGDLAIDGDTV